jgi:hypothetical protein
LACSAERGYASIDTQSTVTAGEAQTEALPSAASVPAAMGVTRAIVAMATVMVLAALA